MAGSTQSRPPVRARVRARLLLLRLYTFRARGRRRKCGLDEARAGARAAVGAAMLDAHGEAFVASPRRFLTLGLFCAIAFLWAGPWICFAPLADVAEARFSVSAAAVNQLATSYLYCYIPGTLLCLYVVDRFGVRVCLAASVSVNTAVVFVRWLALATDSLSPHGQYAVNMGAQARRRAALARRVKIKINTSRGPWTLRRPLLAAAGDGAPPLRAEARAWV